MGYNYVPLSKEDTYKLIERAKNGDEEAKEAIIKNNTGLVKNIAVKFTQRGYELDDLMQIGFIGLLKAAERFDTGFDVMFSTYAVPMIMGEIKRYIRDDGRIKVSRQLKTDIRNMTRLQDEYLSKNGEYPRLSVLAEMMKVTKEELLEIMAAKDALSGIESLDNPERTETAKDGGSLMNLDFTEGGGHPGEPFDMIFLKSIIGSRPEKERQIIVIRYFKDMTQAQIAGRLGISQVQVSRIEKRVLCKLREKIAE